MTLSITLALPPHYLSYLCSFTDLLGVIDSIDRGLSVDDDESESDDEPDHPPPPDLPSDGIPISPSSIDINESVFGSLTPSTKEVDSFSLLSPLPSPLFSLSSLLSPLPSLPL